MTTQGQCESTTRMFEVRTRIRQRIHASPERVWALLTDADGFSRWNSTVERIEGSIERGAKLRIRVPAAPGRTFSPVVKEFDPVRRMVWTEGVAPLFRGVRRFELAPAADGGTDFEMEEVLAGLMVPLARRSLPPFAPIFEAYARDLKAAAEKGGAR